MFKLSVITDEVSQSIDTAIAFAKRHGLDGVEIRSVNEKNPFEMTKADILDIKEKLSGTGLSVCCISSPFYKCDIDSKKEVSDHMEGLKRCIEFADILDCELIRGFTFWNNGNFDDRAGEIAKRFSEPAELLKAAGKTLVLEFDPSVYATNAAKAVKLLKLIDSPSVKALWDPGNDIYDEDNECPYPYGYELIKPYIAHVHIKDAHRANSKTVASPIGCGDVDFKGQLKALINDNYTGFASLETHYRPAHALSDEILKRPGGSAFSYLGEEASEECMVNLNAILNKIK